MKKILLALWLAGAACLAQAADLVAPDVLIKNTVRDVLEVVHQDKDIRAGDQKKILALVDAKVLPHFNFDHMTQLAVGKNWRKATPEQKQALTTEFRNLLVRTYTKAFSVYRDQTVEVKPFAPLAADATEATVKSAIIKPGAPPVPVDYMMEKTPNGWKVYDLAVDGVSLVTTYRGSFTDEIGRSGIDGLIKTLVDRNQQLAANGKADGK